MTNSEESCPKWSGLKCVNNEVLKHNNFSSKKVPTSFNNTPISYLSLIINKLINLLIKYSLQNIFWVVEITVKLELKYSTNIKDFS